MKKLLVVIAILPTAILLRAQNHNVKAMVDSLQYLKADTLDCSADLYWRIVAEGYKAIPLLADKLIDTTQTGIRFHCKAKPLNVGEVAYFALEEIADFPALLVTNIQFDLIKDGCWNFYGFLFINVNKPGLKESIKRWYTKEISKYKLESIPKGEQSACQKRFGIIARYKWKGTQ